ncbi:phage-like protein [Chania multitudinisentens RB-25]|uniref:Phage-like protein n=1 Tax=Chania multitudinisentens RB-25 TaxID=1441930 RepID=W0LJI5_9GAMM|nr:hypothetical protein [Chania multitudinisentens]AHG22160.1 phage-like protein [Chania multitudinisentens RB-25]
MKVHPILFNGDMVRAIIDGRKTQTRRVMKVQPSANFSPMNMALELDYTARWYTPGVVDKNGYLQPAKKQIFGVADEDEGYSCPLGAVGDRLWVREAWQVIHSEYDEDEITYAPEIPKQQDNYWHPIYEVDFKGESREERGFPWRPSLHMPRWVSRLLLEITAVRVERLQDISEEDAKAEGAAPSTRAITPPEAIYRVGFLNLWWSIYGEESWQANPWCWVIEFKLVEKTQ